MEELLNIFDLKLKMGMLKGDLGAPHFALALYNSTPVQVSKSGSEDISLLHFVYSVVAGPSEKSFLSNNWTRWYKSSEIKELNGLL